MEQSGNTTFPKFRSVSGLIEELRMVKDDQELKILSNAVELGDRAFEAVTAGIHSGQTEKDIAWLIQEYAVTHGASDLSFPSIVASGPHAALPHWRASDSELISGSGVVIDMGVVLDGYCSDLTRTIWFKGESNQEPTDKFLRIYDVVRMAQEMAMERIEPGMLGSEAHEIAQTVINQAGYGDFFGHGLGHGVGLDVHEEPRLSPSGNVKLAEGHVVTVEPGIYIPGWGGVRIEDQCVIENGKLRSLTSASKNFPA
jgi:Xaa-Pro aminopeptidase